MQAMRAMAVAVASLLAVCRVPPPTPLDVVAKDYVLLALAVSSRDPHYVESYYGPEEWRKEAARRFPTTASIQFETSLLLKRLNALELAPEAERRRFFLERQLESLAGRVDRIRGAPMSFDEEMERVYGATAPTWTEAELASRLEGLERLLPGDGPLLQRYLSHQQRYLVPPEKLGAVFEAAAAECRRRTADHIDLPAGESYRLELVKGKPWAAYSWYRGDYQSLIQLNVGSPLPIDAMVDLACHEAYPGHHTLQVLLESRRVEELGWQEYTVTPRFSPFSILAEGLAEVGVDLLFPGPERLRFERENLFPLAGLPADEPGHYDAVRRESKKLRAAHLEIARRYLDGELGRREAFDWLRKYALVGEPEAALRFAVIYRAYVASYEVGERRVRQYLEGRARAGAGSSRPWDAFEDLLVAGATPP